METIRQLRYIFSRKQKIRLLFLSVMIVIGALFELLGITAILPFINVAMDPDSIQKKWYLTWLYERLGIDSANTFMAVLAFALIAIYLIKNIYLTIMNYCIFRFTYSNQRALAYRLLSCYLKQPYTFFLKNNSADLIRNVKDDTSMLFDTVLSIMQLAVEFIVCGLLVAYLMIMDKTITIGVGIVLVVVLVLFMKMLKKNIGIRGQIVRESRAGMSKWLLQTFGGIKETKIMEREPFFLRKVDSQYESFAESHCIYQTLSYLPKPFMETACICSLLLVVAIKLLRGVASAYFITTLSVFAVAAFRLLPAFNRITGYISRILFNKAGVYAVYHDLKEVEDLERQIQESSEEKEPLSFEKDIQIRNLSFRYPNVNEYVLQKVNLEIPKNKSVAFIGPSGAGKTTLADIILGVLKQESGEILIDGKDIHKRIPQWHAKLGYIPQSIYLMDDTIRNNIAFAIDEKEINDDRIREVIEEAQLKDFIDGLEDGLDTVIGEQGIRLSGGQRQRIGIARALYANPEVLILDEATSALDNDTESAVMDAINSLAGRKTLIIIAHRLTTIENCDIVYEVRDMQVVKKERKGKDR